MRQYVALFFVVVCVSVCDCSKTNTRFLSLFLSLFSGSSMVYPVVCQPREIGVYNLAMCSPPTTLTLSLGGVVVDLVVCLPGRKSGT